MILNENRDELKGTVKIFFQPINTGGVSFTLKIEEAGENPKADGN